MTHLLCVWCEGKKIVGRLVEEYDERLNVVLPTLVDAPCSQCKGTGRVDAETYLRLTRGVVKG